MQIPQVVIRIQTIMKQHLTTNHTTKKNKILQHNTKSASQHQTEWRPTLKRKLPNLTARQHTKFIQYIIDLTTLEKINNKPNSPNTLDQDTHNSNNSTTDDNTPNMKIEVRHTNLTTPRHTTQTNKPKIKFKIKSNQLQKRKTIIQPTYNNNKHTKHNIGDIHQDTPAPR